MSVDVRIDVKGIEKFFFNKGADPEKLHLNISEVGPGTRAHPPHQHSGQEIFYVLEREGEVVVGEDTYRLNGGEAIHLNWEILHGIGNIGSGPMRYAVIISRSRKGV